MARVRRVAWLVIVFACVVCGAGSASAEFNFDLYGGAAWLESADLGVRGQDNTGKSVKLTIFDIDTSPGFTVGTRFAYWLEPVPFLGFDLDVFYIQIPVPSQQRVGTGTLNGEFLDRNITVSATGVATIPRADLPLFGFSPEIRLRLPLMADADFPYGRIQPYISGGPAWAFSLRNKSVSVEFGGKVGGGMAFALTPWFYLFSEYRYIFFPGFELTDRNLTYRADVKTHNVVGGVSFRF